MQKKYEVQGLNKSVHDRFILKNINLSFKEGLNVIIGQSGAGKSTLLNILGLIDDCTSGNIFFDSTDLIKLTEEGREKFRAERIGFIFQNSNLISDMTVRENLQMAMEINDIHSQEYIEILKRFNIDSLINKKVSVLSGGEQQRIAIARALLKKSKIILADEPTGNLDNSNTELVFEILKDCAEKFNKIVIVVTHDEKMARKYANTLIELSDGEVCQVTEMKNFESNRREVLEEMKNERVKTKLSLKNKIKFVRNFIKRKPARTFTTAFIAALTISLSAIVFFVNGQVEQMFEDMNNAYLETDLVQIYTHKMSISNASEYGGTFSESELAEIKASNMFVATTEFIEMDLSAITINAQSDIIGVRYIELIDFYKDRVMKNDIDGRFPENEYEIILGKDVCQCLFEGIDPLGQAVTLDNGRGNVNVTVVGVNNTKNVEGIYLSYIPNTITFEIASKYVVEFANIDFKSDVDKSSNVYSGGYSGTYGTEKKYPILEGNYPKNSEEIAIDVFVYNEYLKKHNASDLFIEDVYLNVGNAFRVKICGVYDSGREQMFCIDSMVNEMMKKPAPTSLYCYTVNEDVIASFLDTEINKKYSCALMYEHLRGIISGKTATVTDILLIIAIVLCIVTFMIIGSFVKFAIKERTYEIGVIRAIGGSKKDIKSIFWLESLFLGILSAIMSLCLFFFGKIVLVSKFMENTANGNNVWLILTGCVVFAIGLVGFSSVFPLRRINNMHPIECIRHK